MSLGETIHSWHLRATEECLFDTVPARSGALLAHSSAWHYVASHSEKQTKDKVHH